MHKNPFPGISLLLLAICLLPKEAHVTQIHYQKASLEDVVNRSGYILVAKRAAPFITTESISILPEGSHFEGRNDPPYYTPAYHDAAPGERQEEKNYPPFSRALYAFEVVEVLFPKESAVQAGERISVVEAYSAQKLDLHKMYNLEGMRKSPLYQRYTSSIKLTDTEAPESMILFLSRVDGQFGLTYEDAYESLDQKPRVLELIGNK